MSQRSIFAQLYLIFTLLVVPAIGIYEGLRYFAANKRSQEISLAARDLIKASNELKLHADESTFWVYRLSSFFADSASPASFSNSLQGFVRKYDVPLEYAVYTPGGEIVSNNFTGDDRFLEMVNGAGLNLKSAIATDMSAEYYEAVDKLKPVFGRNFFIPAFVQGDACVANVLYQSDFQRDLFRCWVARNPLLMVLVRMPTSILQQNTGLRSFFDTVSAGNISFERLVESRLHSNPGYYSIVSRAAFNRLKTSAGLEFVEIDNSLFSRVQISDNDWVLVSCKLHRNGDSHGKLVVAGLLLLLFLLILLLRAGCFPKRFENLPLLLQICVLMAISAGIPLAILGSVAIDYFTGKKVALIRERSRQMEQFIQQIDRNVELEHARYARLIRQAARSLVEVYDEKLPRRQIIQHLKKNLTEIHSNAHILGTDIAYEKQANGKNACSHVSYRIVASDMHPSDQEVLGVIGRQYLAVLNLIPPEDIPVDKAYMLELVFQKPFNMIIHDLLAVEGTMAEAGWGIQRLALFAEAFKIMTPEFFDHFIVVSIASYDLQEGYIMRHLHGAMRNPWGFSFFAARERNLLNEQKALDLFPEISRLFMRVSDYPMPEPEIVDYQGEKHLFVGLRGNAARDISFCVLFPLAKIDDEIMAEARELLYPAILGVVLVLLMILILYLNLLLPVNRLHQAAQALKERDSTFRLPESQGDEFAEMAAIFNASIGEFEELKIASIVQARLLPSRPFNAKGFSIYGRSQPMIDLGGDYFDYFPVDDDHFALLLGDVAGHGVGASLIMAMAKAGVICGSKVYKDPAAVLSSLHQIVFAIKNRVQRKVMTFQYLLANSSDKRLTYSNAGGCSPVIIDPGAGTVCELKHNGPVLGGFKKTSYVNLELSIKPGQAIVLYTDGMVESRNEKGEELGYNGLYELFLAGFDKDAATYYQNVMNSYQKWLGNAVPGDDVTLIFMVCL